MPLFSELRRRNVFKVALVYAFGGWLLMQIAIYTIEMLGLPAWTARFVALLLLIGFPLALLFAWTYEITPKGLKKAVDVDQTQSIVFKTGQKLNAALAVILVLTLAGLMVSRFFPEAPIPRVQIPDVPILPSPPPLEAPLQAGVPDEIRRFTLDNGLTFIVWPDHDIPNVAMYNFVRAGSRNEYPGITGLSHFFEHMMFNGTSKRAPGEFDRIMEAAGGANNAYTSTDVTAYQDWFPRSALEVIFELEADRFRNLAFDPDVVESERGVVHSERRTSIDNNNVRRLLEQVQATAYTAHPYQFPVIGWPSDIEARTQQDLVDYYQRYYAPNNYTIIVVGDVTPLEIYELAEDLFEPIPEQDPPAPVRTIEPEQIGERRIVVETDAQTPLLHLAFHAGRAADPDTMVMDLLLNILVVGDSSRLHRVLVEDEQLAISVNAYLDEGFDPGLVYFYLTLPSGGDLAATEERLLEELQRVSEEGVTEAELEKARNIVLADFWRSLSTIDGKAEALGEYEVFHDSYEKLFSLPTRIEHVGIEDLQRVAATVFRTTNMTVGILQAPDEDTAEVSE